MIHDLRPYPAYKDSGVEWLGEVPEHWEVFPNRALFEEVKERDCANEQLLSVTISKGIIRQADLLTNSSKKDSSNEDKTNYKLVQPGDIAYNKMRAWQGAVGVSQYRGIVSPAYVVVRPREKQNAKYFHYLLRIPAFAKEAERWSYGITSDQWSLRPEHFKMIYCSLPPILEQSAIVHYLDYINKQIRRYIHAKQKLIKLLEEEKQAIIHRAVTRGLDPDVRLRPSGVEWIGDIPESWEVVRLKQVTTPIEQGWSPQCDAQPTTEDEWGVLKVGCVNRDAFDISQNKKLPLSLEPIPSLEIQDGDILVSRANTRELLGLAALAEKPRRRLILCDKLFRFRALPDRIESRFLVFAVRDKKSRSQIESRTNGASDSMQNIGQGVIKNLLISLPSIDEQKQIVSILARQTEALKIAISQNNREISLLQEYRTRLIADVVTGKLDVRKAAANLSEEIDEPEIFDEETEELEEFQDDEAETIAKENT